MIPTNPQQVLRALDDAWTALLHKHGFVLNRATSSWVSYDGAGTISVAPDAELDDDDCLAQIVLHELCHHWVEGAASREFADWGLDNTNDTHVAHEQAALVLQARLADLHGLRGILVATTDFRPFYEALPDDPFGDLEPHVLTLATIGLDRRAACPIWTDCNSLLARCAALLDAARPNQTPLGTA